MPEPPFDPRTTPARPHLAAASLKGKIAATNYAEGESKTVVAGVADLRRAPSTDATIETQLLFGEQFTVYEAAAGWAWRQSAFDDYVGFVDLRALGFAPQAAHRVTALQGHVYPGAGIKLPPLMRVPMNARLAVERSGGRFANLVAGRCIAVAHIAPLATVADDFVAVAERFIGCPYLWGGRTADGMDCSGLLQTALAATGLAAPRDADMQERQLGRALAAGKRQCSGVISSSGRITSPS